MKVVERQVSFPLPPLSLLRADKTLCFPDETLHSPLELFPLIFSFSFFKVFSFSDLFLLYVYGYFACMYVPVLCVCVMV